MEISFLTVASGRHGYIYAYGLSINDTYSIILHPHFVISGPGDSSDRSAIMCNLPIQIGWDL